MTTDNPEENTISTAGTVPNGNPNGSTAAEPEVVVAAIAVEKEHVNEPVQKISATVIDENIVKKRGFLLTLSTDPLPEELLAGELRQINEKYKTLLADFNANRSTREIQLEATISLLEIQDTEIKEKRQDYLTHLDSLKQEETQLKARLQALHQQVVDLLGGLGKNKQEIVSKSLTHIQEELEQIMRVNNELQDHQNAELQKRYNRDKATFDQKINFWKDILNRHQEHYAEVTDRMKLLARDGINAQTAQFLVYLGGVSALVSGWWFSLWSGPASRQGLTDNVSGNTSVRFFFLDNIGRFLASYSPWVMFLMIMVYVVTVGLFSWACHRLLVRNGFIVDVRELRKKRDKKASEEQEDFEFDLEEQEKLLKAKIRSTAWWGLWLKLTPVILALVPLLGIIAQQLSASTNSPTFQGLFDSLVNEFIGTSIAAMLAVFAIVFITRVSENRYHRKGKQGDQDERPGFNIRYIGFIFFGLMILAMLLYHYPVLFFDDIRRVAIFGFIVSCLATAFSLGYGYIFNGMKNNADLLLFYIDTITSIIHYLSRPFQVNYTTNWSLKLRIYDLQQKMFDLVEGRVTLATNIAFGRQQSNVKKPFLTVHTENGDYTAEATDRKQDKKDSRNKKETAPAKPGFFRRFYSTFRPVSYNPKSSSDEYLDELIVSQADVAYFPEAAAILKELYHQLQEVRDRLAHIEQAREYHWRNLGIWNSLNDQLSYNRKKIEQRQQNLADLRQEALSEILQITQLEKKEITLLKEGYYTGLWFREVDPARNFNMDIPQNPHPLNNGLETPPKIHQ
jgi:hypothetical protein